MTCNIHVSSWTCISNNSKCDNLMVTYRRWLLIRINPKEVFWKLWRSWHIFERKYVAQFLSEIKKNYVLVPASYPHVSLSLSMKMYSQRKVRRRQLALPAICTLPMVPCSFFSVATLQKTNPLRRTLVLVPSPGLVQNSSRPVET